MGAHALFGCTEKVESHKPLMHRNMAVLEDRADRDRELRLTRTAAPQALACGGSALALYAVRLAHHTALRADRAIGPAQRF